jgi:hypothetical protein
MQNYLQRAFVLRLFVQKLLMNGQLLFLEIFRRHSEYLLANPMQFTIVSVVPLDFAGAVCATRVENIGEAQRN